MADEFSYGTRFVCENGSFKHTIEHGTLRDTQATQGHNGGIVSVGSGAEEDLTVGDVATPGWVVMRNLDATNYVTYGPKSGGVMVEAIRLSPGESHTFKSAPSVTWRAIADTASCRVLVKVWEL